MKRRRFYIKNHRYVALALSLSFVVVLYIVLTHIRSVFSFLSRIIGYFSPLIWGIAIAYILWPIVRFSEKRLFFKIRKASVRRALALALTIIIFLAFVAFLAFLLIPNIISSVESLSSNLSSYISTANEFIANIEQKLADRGIHIKIEELFGSWDSTIESIISWLPQSIESIAETFYEIGTGIVNAFIVFIIAIYLLADKERLLSYTKTLEESVLSEKWVTKLNHFLQNCDRIFSRYIGTNFIDAVIVGVSSLIFLLIFNMPYAPLISVIAALFNMIPTFGPIIALVFSGLLLVFSNPWYAFWYLVFAIIVQAIDAYIIKPKLFGGTLGLPAVITLTSIIIFGRIFGLLGVLLGVPLAAILYYLLQHFVAGRRRKRSRVQTASAFADAGELPPEPSEEESSSSEELKGE